MNCRQIQPLLSEYIDDRLSARDTWEVDRHVALCNPCARSLNEMRQTVRLVGETPRFEVSAGFMEQLQSRMASLEPAPPRRVWLSGLRELFRPRLMPAWGAGLAACALALVMFTHSTSPIGPAAPNAWRDSALERTVKIQSVSLAAANPLGDPAAAALVAASAPDSAESTPQ